MDMNKQRVEHANCCHWNCSEHAIQRKGIQTRELKENQRRELSADIFCLNFRK